MSRDRIIQVYRGTTAQNDAFTGAAGEITMDTTRKELRVHDGSTAGGNLVGLKPGFVCPFAGTTAPDGWLICDGSAVSRTTYADLFAVIGTTYGAGDGNSTFNLPNFTNRVIQGGTAGSYKSAGLPAITGTFRGGRNYGGNPGGDCTGAFWLQGSTYNPKGSDSSSAGMLIGFAASRSSSIYGASSTVQPPALCINICVKY